MVGFLHSGAPETRQENVAAFRRGLAEVGYVEGRNVAVEYRWANDEPDRLTALAADLIRHHVAVITNRDLLVALAARHAVPTIYSFREHTAAGGLMSYGTDTPDTYRQAAHYVARILKGDKPAELPVQQVTKVELVLNLKTAKALGITFPLNLLGRADEVIDLQSVETAAQLLRMQVVPIPASDAAATKADIEAFAAEPNGGLLVSGGIFFIAPLVELTRLAARFGLPAIYGGVLPRASEGLMTYSADRAEIFRGAASYVDRLLRGDKVSDLPVQYPTKFRLTINLKTAKALGLQVPPSILLRADEVIE